ncbi:MAG: LytR/AlgR family response regulator transcription factor, partial [Salibacteraceae bacterium]
TKPDAYLIKPFNEESLYSTIEIALFNFQDRKKNQVKSANVAFKDSVFVKNKNMFLKVRFDDILFVKTDHVYLELYTQNNEKHIIRGGLTAFAEKLPSNFYRTHRSYMVNLNYLDAINSVNVIIKKHPVPIGKTYRADLMNSIHIE